MGRCPWLLVIALVALGVQLARFERLGGGLRYIGAVGQRILRRAAR